MLLIRWRVSGSHNSRRWDEKMRTARNREATGGTLASRDRRCTLPPMSTTPTLAERMASFAVGLRYDHLAPAVIHEVKRRVLDSIGCAFGAYQSEPGRVARKVASS